MNKSELIRVTADRSGLTQKDAEAALNAALDAITDALAAGDKIQLVGFGSFETRTRAARTGRNLSKNETVEIPETRVPVFKAGKGLKDAVK